MSIIKMYYHCTFTAKRSNDFHLYYAHLGGEGLHSTRDSNVGSYCYCDREDETADFKDS